MAETIKNNVSIAFTGDITFTKYFNDLCDDESLISADVVKFFNTSDYCVCNVEGPVTSDADKKFKHRNNALCMPWLKRLNGNVWSLANNHIDDFGEEGFVSTLNYAKENDCTVIGAGMNKADASKPFTIDACGGIGILAIGTNSCCNRAKENEFGCLLWDEYETIKNAVREIKKEFRWCVLVVHGGDEFACLPMPYTRKKFLELLSFGADVIVGHHPHVVQNYEIIDDKIIFYSLGNFVFDTDYQRLQKNTEVGIGLKLNFTTDSVSWEHIAVKTDRENSQHISLCETPDIFCDIQKNEYDKLWPLAAKALYHTTKVRMRFIDKNVKGKKFTQLRWYLRLLKWCTDSEKKVILKGKLLSLKGKKASNEAVKGYIADCMK